MVPCVHDDILLARMKVSVMGKALTEEEIATIPEPVPELTAFFNEPTVSPHAMDAASRVVPEDVWKPLGLHTWLLRRAAEVFQSMSVGEREKRLNRLIYVFEFVNDKPVLKTVRLAY